MEILQGICASGGVAAGCIKIIEKEFNENKKKIVSDVEKEIERFRDAVKKAKAQLEVNYENAKKNLGEEEAEIFKIHMLMLEDESLTEKCEEIILHEKINAEYALIKSAEEIILLLKETNDEYLSARADDVTDIKNGIMEALSGKGEKIELKEKSIIFAYDLTPSQTVNLDKSKILAFVTEKGAKNSHASILARSMNVPSLVGVSGCMKMEYNNSECIVDANLGTVCINPDDEARKEYLDNLAKNNEKNEKISTLKGKKSVTQGGKFVKLYANISDCNEVVSAIANDAEGIGLLRSEFLYIGKEKLPDEETQFNAYKEVILKMSGKETIVRTMDIGADKTAHCLKLDKEENPALGYRGIRICLNDQTLFRTQLRALLRASVYGKLLIMFPLIISKDEVVSAIDNVNYVKRQLKEENIPFDEKIQLGIMIETPAAAMISEELAPLVDFFSIGTNDLTQYTLACDRQNDKLEKTYNPYHPAVMKLIELTCKNAHKAGIWVGVCGELAADEKMTQTLIDMGVDELSVSPPYILKTRENIIKSL